MRERNAVSYSKDLRERAKAQDKLLITVDYNGKYTTNRRERVTFQMVETPETVKAIEAAISAMLRDFVKQAKRQEGR